MKLTYFQLEPHLTKKLSPVYIVSGDEILLKQDAFLLIKKAAKANEFHERIRLTPEAGFDWEQLYSLLYSSSLLAEKRLIELDFRDILPNKTASDILKEYALRPSSDVILLIDLAKIDDKISRSSWYQALEKIGISVTIWPIPREQLPKWIIDRAKKYKLDIAQDAALLLTDYVEGNLVAAEQMIEKLYLLNPQKSVNSGLIHELLIDESRFTVFDLTENLLAGNKERSLHILTVLQKEGVEPAIILWAITREIRMLAEMAKQLKNGVAYETLYQKHRIFSRRQAAVRRFLTHLSESDCWQLLQ
ncbi:MAG: DNA polymerase III subunit delta, partial [uncultured bacterium]